MMTEEQAKTKWCPNARHVTSDDAGMPAANRMGPENGGIGGLPWNKCVASDCMAWRFTKRIGSGPIRTTTDAMPDDVPGHTWRSAIDGSNVKGLFLLVGYCGAFGRPED
jgi:hypothetical protein